MRNVSTPDDTTVPVLDIGKDRTDDYDHVRDDRPFPSRAAGGALLLLARSRRGASRGASGPLARLMQADAYSGFTRALTRRAGGRADRRVACWAHARTYFFACAAHKAPIGLRRRRIDALFAIEREINGLHPPNADASPGAQQVPGRWAGHLVARALRQGLAQRQAGKAIAYSPQSLGCTRSLPQRWPSVHEQHAAERAMRRLLPAGVTGPSPAPTKAAAAPLQSTPDRNAKAQRRRSLAWLADGSLACRNHRPGSSTNSCPGTGGDFGNSAPR